jgi:hypothetical protein
MWVALFRVFGEGREFYSELKEDRWVIPWNTLAETDTYRGVRSN